jgi:hypothetical protein
VSVPFRTEVVRGNADPQIHQELRSFGVEQPGDAVCVLRADDDAIAGVGSAFPSTVALIANRPFWIYRSRLRVDALEHERALIKATFDALDAERAGRDLAGEPMGLCVLLTSEQRARFSAEAQWRDPRLVFAGYLSDGRQLRIAYFSDEVYALRPDEHGWSPPPGQRVELFAEQDAVSAEDVIGLWTREGVLPPEEAARRVSELLVVGIDNAGQPIGILTAYQDRSDRLLADFWYFRAFVTAPHRATHLATLMGLLARDHLERRFVSGEDTRAIGIMYEIEYEPWKVLGGKGLWLPSDFLLIGENERGDHLRVHYFAGAPAPQPPPPMLSTAY